MCYFSSIYFTLLYNCRQITFNFPTQAQAQAQTNSNMTNEGEHPTDVIVAAATDAEAADGEENLKNEESEIEGIKESQGWKFPKVKLSAWDPENEKQWEATGKFIAKRNLLASIPNLTCGFGVWLVWSGEYYMSYV